MVAIELVGPCGYVSRSVASRSRNDLLQNPAELYSLIPVTELHLIICPSSSSNPPPSHAYLSLLQLMSSNAPGVLRQAWLKWKALRLPWRRQFLIGSDLSGNTFWEFRDDIRAGRWRRIAKYPTGTHHADVKISRRCITAQLWLSSS